MVSLSPLKGYTTMLEMFLEWFVRVNDILMLAIYGQEE
jgi:hypothetical protein